MNDDINHTFEIVGNVLLVVVRTRELSLYEVAEFKEDFIIFLKKFRNQFVKVKVDMNYVRFIDSSGVAALATISNKLLEKNVLEIINLNKHIRKMFEKTHAREFFNY